MSYCMANLYPEGEEEYCDLYVYGDYDAHTIICNRCPLAGGRDASFTKRSDVIRHLEAHRDRGDPAPYDRMINRLNDEIKTEGDEINYDHSAD